MAKLTEEELLFRKVEEKVKKAIFEYGLIVDGDRILIGLLGGERFAGAGGSARTPFQDIPAPVRGGRDTYRDVEYSLSFGYQLLEKPDRRVRPSLFRA